METGMKPKFDGQFYFGDWFFLEASEWINQEKVNECFANAMQATCADQSRFKFWCEHDESDLLVEFYLWDDDGTEVAPSWSISIAALAGEMAELYRMGIFDPDTLAKAAAELRRCADIVESALPE